MTTPLSNSTESPAAAAPAPGPILSRRPRVSAVVGLRLLEVIRDLDHPDEVLEDEDPSLTMPRRLGLSDVIDRQIVMHRDLVRRRRRMTDQELHDLFQLVARRPDASAIFLRVGQVLGQESRAMDGVLVKVLPELLAYSRARRIVRRGLSSLFGRRVGGFTHGPFALEGRSLLFWQIDPSGGACCLVTGYCQGIVEQALPGRRQVTHSSCQARGDDSCRWTVTAEVKHKTLERDRMSDLLRSPEPEAG
jgi:hypothetical protein